MIPSCWPPLVLVPHTHWRFGGAYVATITSLTIHCMSWLLKCWPVFVFHKSPFPHPMTRHFPSSPLGTATYHGITGFLYTQYIVLFDDILRFLEHHNSGKIFVSTFCSVRNACFFHSSSQRTAVWFCRIHSFPLHMQRHIFCIVRLALLFGLRVYYFCFVGLWVFWVIY